MLNTMKKHGLTLALYAALATGITSAVYLLTQPTIAQQASLQQKALFDQVLPPSMYDNQLQNECYVVTDLALGSTKPHRLFIARKGYMPVAAILETTAPDGYSGAIQLMVAADFNGHVLGVRTLEHHETPGLGDKIELRISDWMTKFANQTVESDNDPRWAVRKDGGMFDQFTGATITPRAVVKAVKQTTLYIQQYHQQFESLPRCEAQ
ncbi:electron transport complex subunit RsxG [Pragia fontium]|uniref:Ion-translocating oxidoreductase complex subunit G n=1 Tax=Pragia fontium DSM 5563 = ATCC 49100 TaxID=1122977 RepID=A0AAJ5BHH4_9GAMM|nr:electron transport complex subunit RsxG [Pragia fontium]SFC96282.1 electron transport complex protein RnfG [Pragia fontium DSM 5563 = ATCC 49100]SUB82509.1 electron transport complex protein RnfG [Pragia fontium]VEJ55410.1 electron transport complex protein RnfG [Pragia fontium]